MLNNGRLETDQVVASSINNINVMLGRNGAGKSRFLRSIDEAISRDDVYNCRYISPERAGVFRRDGNVLNKMERDVNWLGEVRRKNQADNFKAASANLLREIETAYLRRLQDTPDIRRDESRNFRVDCLDAINNLLANIIVEQSGSEFVFHDLSGQLIEPDQISSGESEAIALASEIMYFFETLDDEKTNVLLLDEPDVHLHPDLQARLANFIINRIDALSDTYRRRTVILVATHSTALVCALSVSNFTSIGTKDFGVSSVTFNALSEQVKKVVPFFGHPLSLSLSDDAMLIVEGEDDERVWQQAARSAQGRIRVFPVVAKSVDVQSDLETFCARLLCSVYDDPIAYSIRDGDGVTDALNAVGPIRRYRLQCYAIENALLADECLEMQNTDWPEFQERASTWLSNNGNHPEYALVSEMIYSECRLRHKRIKPIRHIVCAITETRKPWEVVIGQAIAKLDPNDLSTSQTSLSTFIGPSVLRTLISDVPGDA